MLTLRKFLCVCFGNLALLFLVVSVTAVPRIFSFQHAHAHRYQAPTHSAVLSPELISIIVVVVRSLIFAIPLVMTVLYGMAWWTVKNGKASGRLWAIAASAVMVLQGIPILFMTYIAWIEGPSLALKGFLVLDAVMLGIGIPGLIAFAPRNAMTDAAAKAAKPARIAGDGTSRILDTIAWVLQIAGYWFGMGWWYRWGRGEGLHRAPEYLFWIQLLSALLIATAVHELGHAGVGMALGMKLRAFPVGPFQWRIRDGRWKFNFIPSKILSAGGAAGVVPTDPNQSRWNEICMIAAGPVVNLYVGIVAMCVALTAKGQSYQDYWQFLALLATICFVMFAGNLVPLRPEGSYSDGARIYQLLRGGPLVDLYRAFNIVGATLVTPLRPKDYDIEAIQRASRSFTHGHQAFLLRLFAMYHYLDIGKTSQACEALAEAESIYQESASDISAELHVELVLGNAYLRRDAAGARLWWDRMSAKKTTHFGTEYWLAQSAMYWTENRLEDARGAWNKANALAQQLPAAGAYEFDRYRSTLLHQVLETAPAAAA